MVTGDTFDRTQWVEADPRWYEGDEMNDMPSNMYSETDPYTWVMTRREIISGRRTAAETTNGVDTAVRARRFTHPPRRFYIKSGPTDLGETTHVGYASMTVKSSVSTEFAVVDTYILRGYIARHG